MLILGVTQLDVTLFFVSNYRIKEIELFDRKRSMNQLVASCLVTVNSVETIIRYLIFETYLRNVSVSIKTVNKSQH